MLVADHAEDRLHWRIILPAVDASLDREILTGDFGLITSTARAGAVVTAATEY